MVFQCDQRVSRSCGPSLDLQNHFGFVPENKIWKVQHTNLFLTSRQLCLCSAGGFFLSVHIFDLETKNYYLYSLLSTACTQQVDQGKKFLLSLHIWHRALSFGTTPAPPWPTSAQVNKWRLTQIQPALTARVIKHDFPKCIYLNVWMSRGKCSAGGDLADCVWWENISKRRVLRTTCPGWGRRSIQYRNHLSNS